MALKEYFSATMSMQNVRNQARHKRHSVTRHNYFTGAQ